MRRLIIALIAIMLCQSLTSCNTKEKTTETAHPIQQHEPEDNIKEYLYVDFSQLRKYDQRLYYADSGRFRSDASLGTAVVYSDKQTHESLSCEVFLSVDLNGEVLTYSMGIFEHSVIANGELNIADLDGDGIDEIIFCGEVNNNGYTVSKIYRVTNNQIEIFADINDDYSDTFGYSFSFIGDGKIEMFSETLNFRYIQDISNVFVSWFFDDQGYPTDDYAFEIGMGDSYLTVCDDGESDPVLKYYQHVSCVSMLGHVITTLKYNETSDSFEVIEAEYIEGRHVLNSWEK